MFCAVIQDGMIPAALKVRLRPGDRGILETRLRAATTEQQQLPRTDRVGSGGRARDAGDRPRVGDDPDHGRLVAHPLRARRSRRAGGGCGPAPTDLWRGDRPAHSQSSRPAAALARTLGDIDAQYASPPSRPQPPVEKTRGNVSRGVISRFSASLTIWARGA